MSTRLHLGFAVFGVWFSVAGGAAFAAASGPDDGRIVVAQASSAYWLELYNVHAYAPRSRGSDAVSLAYSVSLNGKDYPVQSLQLRAPVSADADLTIPLGATASGLDQFELSVAPTDTVVIRYALVNAKHMDGPALARSVVSDLSGPSAQPAGDYNDSIWPGGATTIVPPARLFFANCDGAVAVDSYTITGAQIARAVADNKGPALISKNYQGADASSGCRTDSNYDVTIRLRAP